MIVTCPTCNARLEPTVAPGEKFACHCGQRLQLPPATANRTILARPEDVPVFQPKEPAAEPPPARKRRMRRRDEDYEEDEPELRPASAMSTALTILVAIAVTAVAVPIVFVLVLLVCHLLGIDFR